jgi:hypothetical protein
MRAPVLFDARRGAGQGETCGARSPRSSQLKPFIASPPAVHSIVAAICVIATGIGNLAMGGAWLEHATSCL